MVKMVIAHFIVLVFLTQVKSNQNPIDNDLDGNTLIKKDWRVIMKYAADHMSTTDKGLLEKFEDDVADLMKPIEKGANFIEDEAEEGFEIFLTKLHMLLIGGVMLTFLCVCCCCCCLCTKTLLHKRKINRAMKRRQQQQDDTEI